jgi:hypothetical protein
MMHDWVIFRVADVFFTAVLLIAALLGVLLVWANGDLGVLTLALFSVALVAPSAYPRRDD